MSTALHERKRKSATFEDTLDDILADWQNAFDQKKAELLEMHATELRLLEREKRYMMTKVKHILGKTTDHSLRMAQCKSLMDSCPPWNKELSAKERDLSERETALIARESQLQDEMEEMKPIVTSNGDIVRLDIGGVHFDVKRGTLCSVEGSLLSSYFCGRWEEKHMRDDVSGRIFMDWDPDDFSIILKVLEACASDVDRNMRIPDPSVRKLWEHSLSLPLPLFYGSQILLTDEHEKWLHDTVVRASEGDGGDNIVPKLLYECTNDSKSAEAFHEACDGKGATLTIVRCTNGCVFGGYNPWSWTSSHGWMRGDNAFLFSLVNPAGTAPTKYNVSNPDEAVYNNSYSGPVFGHWDIYCWQSNGESEICFPMSYEDTPGTGGRVTFTRGENCEYVAYGDECYLRVMFVIDRLEIWSVEPALIV